MMKRVVAAAVTALFLAATAAPSVAQTTEPAQKQTPAKKAPAKKTEKKKKASPKQEAQRQKMKDCAVKWNEHKKASNAKGRKAHREFMSSCLKS
jgi:ABC-type uncharacterized transport system involved in gliding motility auxiliary subunit